ncbi:hypothetical protein ABI_25510 [Asticcacaulis biprosthecium C19]|uniref:Uncharacterized protein n=1 Tax=Asticcacaulis biprosthecium C19 TaxID=715226 RepID=F4QP79_9CAUL|nr:hypothetical protein [Asticcacaulis biprosthecium]EGF91137.1 hypothetical protein ABI_25510 [Asticcacaulis biprosthecium C19]
MSRSLRTQTLFYQNHSSGGPAFLEWFRNRHHGQQDDLIRRDKGRAVALKPPDPGDHTGDAITAILADTEAMARLQPLNLSASPADGAQIRLFDTVAWRSDGQGTASTVGLAAEAYEKAFRQPLPLADLDLSDGQLRRLQATWVALFDEQLGETAARLYHRNAEDQTRTILLAVMGALAAAACAFTALPAVAALAPLVVLGGGEVIDRLNRHVRGLALKDLFAETEMAALVTRTATQQRQEKLIELIQGLFHAVGHLREDTIEIELTEKTEGHVRLIFALYGLLRGNRACTVLHMRAMGMVHRSRGLERLDQALVHRRRAGIGGTMSVPHISRRLRWLSGAAVLAGAALAAGGVWGGLGWMPVVGCAAAAVASLGAGLVKALTLHSRTDRLLSDEKLMDICQEGAFAQVPGPVDVRLEMEISRSTGRLWVRLLREEAKKR